MKLFKLLLVAAVLVAVEITESPFRKMLEKLGFASDEVKAAQCLTVARFLPDEEGTIWKLAAEDKISYIIHDELQCSTPNDCLHQRLSIRGVAERQAHPDGHRADPEILKEWYTSSYCQDLVKSYSEKNPPASKTKELSDAAKQAIRDGFVDITDPTVEACTDKKIEEIKKEIGEEAMINYQIFNEAAVNCGFNI